MTTFFFESCYADSLDVFVPFDATVLDANHRPVVLVC